MRKHLLLFMLSAFVIVAAQAQDKQMIAAKKAYNAGQFAKAQGAAKRHWKKIKVRLTGGT